MKKTQSDSRNFRALNFARKPFKPKVKISKDEVGIF